MYVFGKSIQYKLYAYESGERLPVIPAQSYTVHLFKDKPNRDDAFAGVGAISTVPGTHVSGNVLIFTIPAIDDPDPDSTQRSYNFWLGILFKLEDLEQTQLILRALPIERVHGKDRTIGVTVDRIKEAYPDVSAYLSDNNIESLIRLAQIDMLSDLQNKGYHWAEINKPDQLFNALLFKSLWYIHSSQIQRPGDRFSVNSDLSARNYGAIIKSLQLEIANEDNESPTKSRSGGVVWLSR
jgi:hypothetical protein